jgi:DNA-binding transcriptional regulator WhiA
MKGYFRNTILNENKFLQSYIVGLAIGDGNLSNPNGRAIRLRITCDKKYPFLIKRIVDSLQSLLPQNKVSIVERKEGCSDISVYSNHLEKLLGWKVGKGSKFMQEVSIPDRIKQNKKCRINCLRGLIETDGSIYFDRGYRTVSFSTIIPELANDVFQMIGSLGFNPNIYRIKRGSKYNFDQKIIYCIRLSKNVSKFLEIVRPGKK